LHPQEIENFRIGDLRYGLFVHDDVPVFLLDIAGFMFTDLTLNIALESEDVHRDFFDHEANIINLILCDYPAGVVKALRSIGIDSDTMHRIKEVCRRQRDGQQVRRQIYQVYQKFTTRQMIDQTDMIRLVEAASRE